ncbi:hypothetical protein ASD81_16565 [Nocardioides sp. Root614]|nr:hypothetical protein ASD81_16565 [Nocardioides sp. Root614]KRA88420.1 hypothetical protein ASD84_16835 [Nocardioides sp. Root682]
MAQNLVVDAVSRATDDVVLVHLVHPDGDPLPRWSPGAHLELELPSGLLRQYSLCGDIGADDEYTVAVLRVPDGRGGSVEVHDSGLVGQQIAVRGPINRFKLIAADHYVLLAGGIGITPISAMARDLAAAGSSWELIYGGRSRSAMAFADDLLALDSGRVSLVPQDTAGLPDLVKILSAAPKGTAVYCCGPQPMIEAVEQVCSDLGIDLHLERFSASGKQPEAPEAGERPFEIELGRRGLVLEVGPDDNALDVVREVVLNHPYSCHEGTCGSCEVSVLSGQIDHRDEVLSDEEREANDTMMLCVSRALSDRLVIDL